MVLYLRAKQAMWFLRPVLFYVERMTEEVTLMGLFHRNRIPSKEFSFAFKNIKDTKLNTNKFTTEKTLKRSVQSTLLSK